MTEKLTSTMGLFLTYFVSVLLALFIGFSTFTHFFENQLPAGEASDLASGRRVQVLFKTIPSRMMLKDFKSQLGIGQLKKFDPYPSDFFSRLYEVIATESQLRRLKQHEWVEGIHVPKQVKLMAVYGSKSPSSLHNDTFAQMQWPLENVYVQGDENVIDYPDQANGHLVLAEQTDVQTSFISSKPVDGSSETFSVDYGDRVKLLADHRNEEQTTVTVAIIDSGVDYNHKDLKDNIRKNMDECVVNRLTGEVSPGLPRRDKDGNGYKGDCVGWNFTVKQNQNNRNKPVDVLSHGTHIAGIISAVRNNEYGIAGVSDRIKILPLKVIGGSIDELEDSDEKEEENPEDAQEESEHEVDERLGFTDAVTKAIRYATANGADVINMSLGWPRIADLDIVREAIREAREAGVTIVAASGNDGHSSLIMPCAIEGVICVGSINNNGVVSSFSNYGGHVDLLAPGFGIMSTFPDDSRLSPTINGSGPFEIKDGTSQAAPYVSAGAALLKLRFPQISEDELLARMLISSRPVYERVSSQETLKSNKAQAGLIQYESMLGQKRQAVLYPSFKELGLVEVDSQQLKGRARIKLRSLWDTSRNVEFRVKSHNQDVQITLSPSQFDEISPLEAAETEVEFSFSDFDAESFVAFELISKADGQPEKSVWHQVSLSRDLVDNDVVSVQIEPLPEGSLQGLRHVKTLRGEEQRPTFYHVELLDDQAKLHVLCYDGQRQQMIELPPVTVPELHRRFPIQDGPQESLFLLDLNDDGLQDYLLISAIQTEEGLNYAQLSYYNHEMKPLYGETHSHIRLPEGFIIPNWIEPRLIRRAVQGLGKVRVPVFATRGILPQLDKKETFEFPPEVSVVDGTYYLDVVKDSGRYQFKPRLIENPRYMNHLLGRLGLRDVDRLQLVHVLPQSKAAYLSGEVELLYHYDSIGLNKAAIVTIGNKTLDSRTQFKISLVKNSSDFSSTLVIPSLSIKDGATDLGSGSSYFTVLEGTKLSVAVSSVESNREMRSRLRFRGKSRSDIMSLSELSPSMYIDGDKSTAIFQTGKSLVALSKVGSSSETSLQRRIVRSTFLPGFFFSEVFYPTVIKSTKGFDPAVYVDSTSVLSGNIMLWQVSGDSAKVPIRYNVMIPDNCLTADQAKWDQTGTMASVLRCVDPETEVETLKFFPFD